MNTEELTVEEVFAEEANCAPEDTNDVEEGLTATAVEDIAASAPPPIHIQAARSEYASVA